MDVDAVVDLEGRRPRLAGLVAALGAEDVALVPLGGEGLGQVGQVLGRRGVIGPVVLVDEQQPPGPGHGGSVRMQADGVGRRLGAPPTRGLAVVRQAPTLRQGNAPSMGARSPTGG